MNEIKTSVAAQVAALPGLSIKDLWQLWDRYFPRRPNHPNRVFLESRIAYKLQEQAFGGLSSTTHIRGSPHEPDCIGLPFSTICAQLLKNPQASSPSSFKRSKSCIWTCLSSQLY